MEELIPISWLNDFLFCPASIYFHNLMNGADRMELQSEDQINGTAAHSAVDEGRYSTRSNVLQGTEVYSERYGITGRIDVFDVETGILTERKKHQSVIYPGLVLQVYGQYFGLTEAGYTVKRIRIHSLDDNKNFEIPLPCDNKEGVQLLENTLSEMSTFKLSGFEQTDTRKCRRCIYRGLCTSTDYDDEH